ncbi:MAG: GPR endopeptidase [Clostridia bacterium]|nr:GPR endopeptidase [Clostridia bacterium]
MKPIYNTDLACENLNIDENYNCLEEDLGYCTIIRQNDIFQCVTVFCDKLNILDEYSLNLISLTISEELTKIIESIFEGRDKKELSYLIIGLGNSDFTADSIGPRTVSKLSPTRHLNTSDNTLPLISIFSPSVLSKSGIETVDIVRSISNKIAPDLIIAIDSLSARSCDRLGTTIQISSNGIAPGSGVRNARSAINEETVGIPVIAIGVPTVVDSATLVLDTLEKANFQDINDSLFSVLRESKTFFVTPKECDELTEASAKLISRAINGALEIIS